MTEHELHSALSRLQRFFNKVKEKSGIGFVDIYELDDGDLHIHKVTGIKSGIDFEDELVNAITWAWNIKDYLKETAKARKRSPKDIEKLIDREPSLQLLSDLANGVKHGKLRESRSGRFAYLGLVKISFPQKSIASITFHAKEVDTEICNSELVEFTAPVHCNTGEIIGEAGEILMDAVSIWEREGVEIALNA